MTDSPAAAAAQVPKNFGDRLDAALRAKGNPVCVGLDPRWEALPEPLRARALEHLGGPGPEAAAHAFLDFALRLLDAVAPLAPAVKVQNAFFEQYGPPGVAAYGRVLREARARGLVVLGDAKRADIGSTAAAYAAAHLGPPAPPAGAAGAELASGDLVADAVTVNPYFGRDGVEPFIQAAAAHGRGLFVLVRTSNKSAGELQDLEVGGRKVYERVAELVAAWGAPYVGAAGYSLVGAVAGATWPAELARLRALLPRAILLVPGYGAQGAGAADVRAAFDAAGRGALVNSSRGICEAWRAPEFAARFGPERFAEAAAEAVKKMAGELLAARRP